MLAFIQIKQPHVCRESLDHFTVGHRLEIAREGMRLAKSACNGQLESRITQRHKLEQVSCGSNPQQSMLEDLSKQVMGL